MNDFDSTLYNLRPRPASSFVPKSVLQPGSAYPPNSQPQWGPGMWRLIDQQMCLRECTIYRYSPEEFDPFEDDEAGHMWSINYFFFNRIRKRVCYLYLQGISILARQSGIETPLRTPMPESRNSEDLSDGWISPNSEGAQKRARYWFGDREAIQLNDFAYRQSNKLSTSQPVDLLENFSPPQRPVVGEHDEYLLSDEDTRSARSHSTLRAVSEDILGPMDVWFCISEWLFAALYWNEAAGFGFDLCMIPTNAGVSGRWERPGKATLAFGTWMGMVLLNLDRIALAFSSFPSTIRMMSTWSDIGTILGSW